MIEQSNIKLLAYIYNIIDKYDITVKLIIVVHIFVAHKSNYYFTTSLSGHPNWPCEGKT